VFGTEVGLPSVVVPADPEGEPQGQVVLVGGGIRHADVDRQAELRICHAPQVGREAPGAADGSLSGQRLGSQRAG